MKKCIDQVVKNVNNKFYGNSIFEPSGPLMVKKFFTEQEFNQLKLNLKYMNNNIKLNINYNNFPILHFHDNYRIEQPTQNKHWSQYWEERNMYV
jgi:hypothetical protein